MATELLKLSNRYQNSAYDGPIVPMATLNDVVGVKSEESYKVANKYYIDHVSTSPSSTWGGFGKEVKFTVPSSELLVGDFFLEVNGIQSGGTATLPACWLANLLTNIKCAINNTSISEYSGEALLRVLLASNTEDYHKKKIVSAFGDAGAAASAVKLIVPLILPGSRGIFYNPMHKEVAPMFEIGKFEGNMLVTISTPLVAEVDPAGYMTITSFVLHYKKATVQDSNSQLKVEGASSTIYATMHYPILKEVTIDETMVSGVAKKTDLKDVLYSGDLKYLIVSKIANSDYATSKKKFAGYALDTLKVTVNGDTNIAYQHDSSALYDMKNMLTNKGDSIIANVGGTTIGRQYIVPFSDKFNYDLYNLGVRGLSCNGNSTTMNLFTSSSASEVQRLHVVAMGTGYLNIYANQTIKLVDDMNSFTK